MKNIRTYLVAQMTVAKGVGNVDEAISVLYKAGVGDALLSKSGMTTGYILADMMMNDAGKITSGKLDSILGKLADAGKASTIAIKEGKGASTLKTTGKLIEDAADDAANLLKDYYPTLAERIKYEDIAKGIEASGNEITPFMRQWLDNSVSPMQRWAVKAGESLPIRTINKLQGFLGFFQTRASTSQAIRNFMQNEVTVAYTRSFGAILKGKGSMLSALERRGMAMNMVTRGFSSIGTDVARETGMEAAAKKIPVLKNIMGLSESAESLGKLQAAHSFINEGVDKFWIALSRNMRDDFSVVEKTLGKDVAKRFFNTVKDYHDPFKGIEEFIKTNGLHVANHLDEEGMMRFRTIGLDESINDLYRSTSNPVARKAGMQKIIADLRESAYYAAQRSSFGIGDDLEFGRDLNLMQEAGVPEHIQDLLSRQNAIFHSFEDLASDAVKETVDGSAVSLRGLPNAAEGSHNITLAYDALKNKLDGIRRVIVETIEPARNAYLANRNPESWKRYFDVRTGTYNLANEHQLSAYETFLNDAKSAIKAVGGNPDALDKVGGKWDAMRNEFGLWKASGKQDAKVFASTRVISSADNNFFSLFNNYKKRFITPNMPWDATQVSRWIEQTIGEKVDYKSIWDGSGWTPELGQKIENALMSEGLEPTYKHIVGTNLFDYRSSVIQALVEDGKLPGLIPELDNTFGRIARTRKVNDAIRNIIDKYAPDLSDEYKKLLKAEETNVAGTGVEDAVKQANQIRISEIEQTAEKRFLLERDFQSHLLPNDGNIPTMDRYVADNIEKTLQDVNKVTSEMDTIANGSKAIYGKNVTDILKAFAEKVNPRFLESRATIMDYAQKGVDNLLLDYDSKRGFDRLLGYVFPYQFWYSRSYGNWIKRFATQPWGLAAYAKYRHYSEVVNKNLPEWWKYNVNLSETLGLNTDSDLFINLEALYNPFANVFQPDFNDSNRRASIVEATFDDLSKLSPVSLHPVIPITIGLIRLMMGDKDIAASWLPRFIGQTSIIKSATEAVGFDPFNTGGLELDPLVILQGGTTRMEDGRIALSASDLIRQYPESQAAILEQIRNRRGQWYDLALRNSSTSKIGSNLTGSILGVGLKGRTSQELLRDQFYNEMSNLMALQSEMSAQEYRDQWNKLEERYPFAESLLLLKKQGVASDQAFVWNVLSRIPPGQSSKYMKWAGIEPGLADAFFNAKGNFSLMNPQDVSALMSGIESLGGVLACPADGVKHEWNYASSTYSKFYKSISPEVSASVTVYESLKDDAIQARKYIIAHPEVEQYYNSKQNLIMGNPILFKYYGGINFLETYYDRIVINKGEARWPGITLLNAEYNAVVTGKGDTKRFLKEHPEITKYHTFMAEQKKVYMTRLGLLADKLPEVPSAGIRSDANTGSAAEKAILDGMSATPTNDVPMIDAVVEKYMNPAGTNLKVSDELQKWLNADGDRLWPGVVKKNAMYESLAASNVSLSQTYLIKNPDVVAFRKWMRENAYKYPLMGVVGNSGEKSETNAPPQGGVPSDYMARLLQDYFRTGVMPPALETALRKQWKTSGSSEPFGAWIQSLRSA